MGNFSFIRRTFGYRVDNRLEFENELGKRVLSSPVVKYQNADSGFTAITRSGSIYTNDLGVVAMVTQDPEFAATLNAYNCCREGIIPRDMDVLNAYYNMQKYVEAHTLKNGITSELGPNVRVHCETRDGQFKQTSPIDGDNYVKVNGLVEFTTRHPAFPSITHLYSTSEDNVRMDYLRQQAEMAIKNSRSRGLTLDIRENVRENELLERC